MTDEITQVAWASCGGLAARSAASAEGQRDASASAASALGSTQSYCFTPNSQEGRRLRWAARAMLWQASSLKPVRCCGRMLHNDESRRYLPIGKQDVSSRLSRRMRREIVLTMRKS